MRRQRYLRSLRLLVIALTVLFCSFEVLKAQSPPNGPAGGVLAGTYPNPGLAVDRVRKTGDSMTGVLDISMPGAGGIVAPFSLTTPGNAGPDRGLAFLFNLPSTNPNSALGARIIAARESWGLQSYMSFGIHNGTAMTEGARITSGGRFGIGTTAPAAQLHISNATAVATTLTAGYGGGIISFQDTNGPLNSKLYQWRSEGGVFRMALINDAWSGFVQQNILVATSAGKIGIGTATPLYSLDVNGGTNGFRTKAASSSSNDTIASFESASGIQAIVRANGYVGIGITAPTAKLHVVGDGRFTGNLTVDGNIAAKYQDVAEWVQSSQELVAGTVVVLDSTKSNQVIASTHAYDTRVAGVISSQPGITLGENGAGKVLVAATGRVRIKVDASRGSIQIGDLLVTSDIPGVAMKSQPINVGGAQIHRPGTLIGKALEPLAIGTGEILVLLSLQ